MSTSTLAYRQKHRPKPKPSTRQAAEMTAAALAPEFTEWQIAAIRKIAVEEARALIDSRLQGFLRLSIEERSKLLAAIGAA